MKMKDKRLKTKIARKLVELAINKAYHSVGKSFPCGVHEVEVPKELRVLMEKHEEN